MEEKNYIIKDGFNNMDFERVTELLSKSYWSPGIKIEEVKQGAVNSAIVVGAFNKDGKQIGFARAISDMTRFAYIMDVIVDEQYRRQGIGQALVKHMITHKTLQDVYQWVLITKDAHEVYAKLGFVKTQRPNDWMEIKKERPMR